MIYRFLIYISHSYGIPIGEPLEQEIEKRGYQVKWFADMSYSKKKIKNKDTCDSIQDIKNYHPHVVLTATDSVPDFIPGIKVQLFHGFLAFKHSHKRGHFRIRGFFDLYCTQGASTTSIFKQKEKKYGYFDVVETGWSKVDPLFPIVKREVHARPTLLIASTFSPKYSLAHNPEVVEVIKNLSNSNTFKILVVLHPKMSKDIVNKFKTLVNDNLSFHKTTNLIPLFKQADVMLGDTTSAITEFLLQEKPVVTFKNNKPGPHLLNVETTEEIVPALEKGLTEPEQLMNSIREYIKVTHPYKDGQSSARVVEASVAFLHKNKDYLKPKPINLVRRFKMRRKLGDFKSKTVRHPITLTDQKNREKVTAIIPVYNEAHNIENTLKSVAFADETMVVDSYSTDDTVEIAKKYTDFVIQRDFEYPASQKNWAIPQASYEWILLLDADERVTPALQDEILEILAKPEPDINAYWIYRKNHFMGKEVRYSGWQNDKVIRLFKKSYNRYEDKMVHEEIISEGTVGFLKNRLHHNTYVSLDHYLNKLNKYSYWQARDYDSITGTLTPFHFLVKPFWKFFKHYIIQQGFRDGIVGFSVSFLQSYSVVLRYMRLYLYRRDIK
ncbi:glycosyltransferase [Flavimarina sp. Hel_I_48]|uniref:glycosyltransferase n=1 Tax=Flavimarina sp. Hel_I_48 TaxID=1392488 RepID=UPI000B122DD7|nr:glycosyltransferase [Flavimarina sp. Hel_I_48]